MGQLTEFFMKSAGGPPPSMGFSMPMMKGWVPRRIQPWLYVLTAFCFQFSGGVYLGALDGIRGTTNFMIEDVLFLLYATLAGMAVYFPMLFRMKFRFTNQQLLCSSAIVLGVCNMLTMYCQSMPILTVVCFIAGMAKIQGTFECMSFSFGLLPDAISLSSSLCYTLSCSQPLRVADGLQPGSDIISPGR